jgi:hypothetical protein
MLNLSFIKTVASAIQTCTKRACGRISRRRIDRPVSPALNAADRYLPCTLLSQSGIRAVVWFEDLLVLHGSDTQVWDLNLLVEDSEAAAKVLIAAGYVRAANHLDFDDQPEFHDRSTRLILTAEEENGIVLLPARDWHYEFGSADGLSHHLPPISNFIDSMIGFWLDISEQDYVDRLRFALWVGCMIYYA